MDLLKEAFSKVKEDINSLRFEIDLLKKELIEIKRTLSVEKRQTDRQTIRQINQTNSDFNQTDSFSSNSKPSLYSLNPQNFDISTGNRGVQTDRQTNRQTDRQMEKFAQEQNIQTHPSFLDSNEDPITHLEKVSKVLDSLDSLKKELRFKLKKLTNQEMFVFISIYSLSSKGFIVDYSLLSEKTSLSESSIRDYVQKIISKGLPIQKTKENNKKVTLSIPKEFQKVASLSTIISLRNL